MQQFDTVPTSTAQVRRANRIQVLRGFLGSGPRAAGDVAEQVGLSRQTVMKSIQFFLRTGLLVSGGKGESTTLGGKRPELFELTRDRFFLCITMWPEYLHIHLATVGGIAVADLVQREPLAGEPKQALARVGRLCAGLARDNGIRLDKVAAVSISTAGIMDYATGTLRYSSQSPGWGNDVPLTEYLRPWFPGETLIFAENTGKMAARPLLLEEDLADKRVMVIFSCWGLSGCLMDRGSILSGGNSLIGEIGHMTIDPNDPEVCGCGSRGCLERLVSARRLRELAARWTEEHPTSCLAEARELTVQQVFAASEQGDSLAQALSRYLGERFAVVLRNVSLVFDPDVVVFQGDYAHADELFRQTLLAHVEEFRYFPERGPFELRFDRRELAQMDTKGSLIALTQQYFGREELYTE